MSLEPAGIGKTAEIKLGEVVQWRCIGTGAAGRAPLRHTRTVELNSAGQGHVARGARQGTMQLLGEPSTLAAQCE